MIYRPTLSYPQPDDSGFPDGGGEGQVRALEAGLFDPTPLQGIDGFCARSRSKLVLGLLGRRCELPGLCSFVLAASEPEAVALARKVRRRRVH
jgi:hypothetical protein